MGLGTRTGTRTVTRITTGVVALGLAGTLAGTLTACGSSSASTSSAGSSAASSSSPSNQPLAKIASLSGQDTQVALDPNFLTALQTLKLTPGTVGTATLNGGTLSFPITGGNVSYYSPSGPVQPYVQGKIDHQGSGISLTAGTTKVELTNFTIDPAASKLYGDVAVNGAQAASQAYLFFLDGSTLQPLSQPTPTTAVLQGTKVEISPDAAALLNKTFGTTAVMPNSLVGVAKITVNTK